MLKVFLGKKQDPPKNGTAGEIKIVFQIVQQDKSGKFREVIRVVGTTEAQFRHGIQAKVNSLQKFEISKNDVILGKRFSHSKSTSVEADFSNLEQQYFWFKVLWRELEKMRVSV